MRALIVVAVLVGAIFMILFVLTDLVRELSRLSSHSAPDLGDSDDGDVTPDRLDDIARPLFPRTEQRRAIPVQNRIAGDQGYNFHDSSNALDDLRSAL
jgi:hypothetical protein